MGKALYRKYRPKTLAEVVGEPQVTDVLKKALDSQKIAHAYLFIGPRGCGKTSVARIFAHEINQFPYEIEDNYVDIIEIDAASNTGVDNIRELREKAAIAPSKGKYKVYIIDEVHMLSKSAFNALLKTLEEPPKHVIFIMATTDAYKVPVTITSRSQVYTFKLADVETMFNHVKNICAKEKIAINDEAIKLIVKRGGGSFRDTLSILDQLSTLSDGKEITKEQIIAAMGLPEDEVIDQLLTNYQSGNVVNITTTLKELLNANVRPETIASEIIEKIIAEPKIELLPLLKTLPEVKDPFPEAKLLSALLEIAEKTQPNLEPQKTAPEPKPTPISTQPTQPTPHDANLDGILDQIKSKNEAIYSQLTKAILKIEGNVFHIYPTKKITKTIISRDANKAVIIEALNGLKIEIHEVEENPNLASNNTKFSVVSDIMGAVEEVKNDGGENNPF